VLGVLCLDGEKHARTGISAMVRGRCVSVGCDSYQHSNLSRSGKEKAPSGGTEGGLFVRAAFMVAQTLGTTLRSRCGQDSASDSNEDVKRMRRSLPTSRREVNGPAIEQGDTKQFLSKWLQLLTMSAFTVNKGPRVSWV
jgi:hypothetical protein